MHHEADVGLVDPHPEGDRRHHDPDLVKNERFLDPLPLLRRQPRVVGGRGDAARAQVGGQVVRALAGGAVDDAGLALVRRQEPLKLSMRVVLLDHLQADVGPVEAGDEAGRLLQPQLVADVVAGVRVGGGGERDERHPGKAVPQPPQRHVLRPEVVPPLRDAVRLVDGDEGDAGAAAAAVAAPTPAPRPQRRQPLEKRVARHPLRRHVQQVEPAGHQVGQHPPGGPGLQRRVVGGRPHAVGAQGVHLVLHQRDERRHHDARARPQQRRDLIAERLPAPAGHEHEGVLPARTVSMTCRWFERNSE